MVKTILGVLSLLVMLSCSTTVKENTIQPNIMETNKKNLGNLLALYPKPMTVWGGHGNESQHSFYQFLREGTAKNAIDVFWCEKPGHAHKELHRVLMANAKAQTEALVTRDPKSKYFNVVSTVSIEELTPETLGALMAMYEHKTTMLGTLFGINAFDQPGVELGKKLANEAYKKIS